MLNMSKLCRQYPEEKRENAASPQVQGIARKFLSIPAGKQGNLKIESLGYYEIGFSAKECLDDLQILRKEMLLLFENLQKVKIY